jgi:hypothetical protein
MDLEEKTIVELKDICRERKIKGFSQLQKRPLINLIKKDVRKSDKAAGKASGKAIGRPVGRPPGKVGRPPGKVGRPPGNTNKTEKTGKRDVFLDAKNFVFDNKLRPFGKLYNGELKKLSQSDISFLEGEGYKVLKVDVKATDDMIFDTLPVKSKKYQYRHASETDESDESEDDDESDEFLSDSDSSDESNISKKERMVKAKFPRKIGAKKKSVRRT